MIKYYIVDAFADKLFSGNQAGVCVLDEWIAPELMQQIAAENNLSETAFVVQKGEEYDLRWFTPDAEVDLCGHATLGTAFVISQLKGEEIKSMNFHTQSGLLTVSNKEGLFEMDFPSRSPQPVEISSLMKEVAGVDIKEAWLSRDLLLVLETEEEVQNLKPDLEKMKAISDCLGVVVTARGKEVDFVSRFFAPNIGVPEDPVTGSSHASLIPFWAERLGRNKMTARQLSKRGGTLYCEFTGDRVKIAGYAKLYLEGGIHIPE